MMRAMRDNHIAAASMGKDVKARQLEIFVFGAVLMGIGGALLSVLQPAVRSGRLHPDQPHLPDLGDGDRGRHGQQLRRGAGRVLDLSAVGDVGAGERDAVQLGEQSDDADRLGRDPRDRRALGADAGVRPRLRDLAVAALCAQGAAARNHPPRDSSSVRRCWRAGRDGALEVASGTGFRCANSGMARTSRRGCGGCDVGPHAGEQRADIAAAQAQSSRLVPGSRDWMAAAMRAA